jgi:hypothetical protein
MGKSLVDCIAGSIYDTFVSSLGSVNRPSILGPLQLFHFFFILLPFVFGQTPFLYHFAPLVGCILFSPLPVHRICFSSESCDNTTMMAPSKPKTQPRAHPELDAHLDTIKS